MELHLVDTDRFLVDCWKREFVQFPEVHIHDGDILQVAENTIVSPANGLGIMDGGIDSIYSDFFGSTVQQHVQAAISRRPDKQLPVGTAVFVRTDHDRIPFMIAAPTMLVPGPVGPENSFFAMAAVLTEADRNRRFVSKVFCPGLATGVGQVPAEKAAREMANAYKKHIADNRKGV